MINRMKAMCIKPHIASSIYFPQHNKRKKVRVSNTLHTHGSVIKLSNWNNPKRMWTRIWRHSYWQSEVTFFWLKYYVWVCTSIVFYFCINCPLDWLIPLDFSFYNENLFRLTFSSHTLYHLICKVLSIFFTLVHTIFMYSHSLPAHVFNLLCYVWAESKI